MLPNSLMNGVCCTMSHRRPSSSSRKKLSNPLPSVASSPDTNAKSKEVTPTSLYTAKVDRTTNQCKSESSHRLTGQSHFDDKLEDTELRGVQATISSNREEKLLNTTEIEEKSVAPEQSNTDEKEGDLIGMLTRQLYLAESQMQRMQLVLKKAEDRLKSKDQDIGRLKRKVKDWEAKSKNQDLIHKKEMQQQKIQIEDSEYLYKRCLSLEHKIFEMEKFLADYGLVWVGESKTEGAKRPDSTPNDFIKNCYAQLTANIEELNMSVGKGEVHVQRNQNGGGASFKTPSCMCLKFYKNGMIIGEGKLRSYNNPKTGTFIRDILDGYFPSELQRSYPNGVPFKVEDHRKETYLGNGAGFPGHGHRLGKQSVASPQSQTTTTVKSSSIKTPAQASKCSASSSDNKKQYCYNFKTGMPSVPSSARSSKTKFHLDSSSVHLLDLRSQILASHNNNCSDTHLQSHINAELGLTSRSEKKRTPATKTTEYHMSMNEGSVSSRGLRPDSVCPSNRSRTSQNGSTERLAFGSSSPSRLACSPSGMRSRPRSASLNSGRYPLRPSSRMSNISGNDSASRNFYCTTKAGSTKPRITRSATLDRNNELPIVREINEATGKPGELRLKVRSMNGSIVFLVHVSADDTVAMLYQLLDKALSKGRPRNYKLVMSGYERKRLDHFGVPLRECGISRDSVLHLIND